MRCNARAEGARRRMQALMKSILKTIAIIATVHSAVWWGSLGAPKASGFILFTFESLLGLAPPPRHSMVQTVMFQLTGVLTYPLAWVPGVEPATWFTILLVIAANGIIWGVCLGELTLRRGRFPPRGLQARGPARGLSGFVLSSVRRAVLPLQRFLRWLLPNRDGRGKLRQRRRSRTASSRRASSAPWWLAPPIRPREARRPMSPSKLPLHLSP